MLDVGFKGFDLIVHPLVEKYPTVFKSNKGFIPENPPGWNELLENFFEWLEEYMQNNFTKHDFAIIKAIERKGVLKIGMYNWEDEVFNKTVEVAEYSKNICQYCGDPAKFELSKGIHRSVCEKHSLMWKVIHKTEEMYDEKILSIKPKHLRKWKHLLYCRNEIIRIFEESYSDTFDADSYKIRIESFFKNGVVYV